MKQLICEMCGGTDLIKQDGVFVCQSCGTKYSVEEARKMMVEGTVEVVGTVKVDNSDMLSNYYSIAVNAYDAGNKAEAEVYCNKIIEIDPENYLAWLLKGKTAGWQSSLGNIRFNEAINCFVNSIKYAPQEEKNNIIEDSKKEIKNLAVALIQLRSQRFETWPDGDETQGFANDISQIINAAKLYIMSTGIAISASEILTPIAAQINVSVVNALNKKIIPDYNNDDDNGHPSDFAFKLLLERAGYCSILLLKSIGLSDDDDESDISRYEDLISIHNLCMNARSYEYKTVEAGHDIIYGNPLYVNKYVEKLSLSSGARAARNQEIQQYREKIVQIKERIKAKNEAEIAEKRRIAQEEKQKQIDAYWHEHANEKSALEGEKLSLLEKVASLEAEIAALPENGNKVNIIAQIDQHIADKDALSVFKAKEKKAIQAQIDDKSEKLKMINESLNNSTSKIKAVIEPLNKRIEEINTELTKDI